jgi:hypothetical protein
MKKIKTFFLSGAAEKIQPYTDPLILIMEILPLESSPLESSLLIK